MAEPYRKSFGIPGRSPTPPGPVLQRPYEEWLDSLRTKRRAQAGLAQAAEVSPPPLPAPPPADVYSPLAREYEQFSGQYDRPLTPGEQFEQFSRQFGSPQAEAAEQVRAQQETEQQAGAYTRAGRVQKGAVEGAAERQLKPGLMSVATQYLQSRGGGEAEGPPVGVGTARGPGIDWSKLPENLQPGMVGSKPVYFPPDYAERVANSDLDDATKAKLLKELGAHERTEEGLMGAIQRREVQGLKERTEAQMGAIDQSAYGDQMVSDALDQGVLDQQDILDQQKLFFNDWKQNTQKEMIALKDVIEKHERGEIDPDRYWKKMGSARIGMAAIASALFGNHPGAQWMMQTINQGIQNDIQGQLDKRQGERLGIQARQFGIQQMRANFSTEQEALQAYSVLTYKNLLTYVESLKSRTASMVKKKRLEEMEAGLRTELDTAEQKYELAAKMAGRQAAYEAYMMRLRSIAGKKSKDLEGTTFVPSVGKHVPNAFAKGVDEKMQGLDDMEQALITLKEIQGTWGNFAWVPGTEANLLAKNAQAQVVASFRKINEGGGAFDKGMQELGEDTAGADPTSPLHAAFGNVAGIEAQLAKVRRERELTKEKIPGVAGVEAVGPEGEVIKKTIPTGEGQVEERVTTGREAATQVTGRSVKKYEGKPVQK